MTPTTGRGAVSDVLAAFESGATSLEDAARRTGRRREVVEAAVDTLIRMGRMDARQLASGCPSGGCGSCASGTAEGQAGCGATGPSAGRTGPVLVTLSVRRPGT